MSQQQIIVVTGMHRSGTSLISSILQRAGVNVGDNLIGSSKGNPRGHFEDVDFYNFHEKILRRFGQSILVQDAATLGKITPEETQEALALIEQRSAYEVWGWKDPRTSLFLEFWHNLLPTACYVFVYRHPVEIVLSLLRRGTDLEAQINPMASLRAWQVHNECILDFYQKHTEVCILCNIFGIVENIEAFIDLVEKRFALPLQKEGAQSLFYPGELKRVVTSVTVDSILTQIAPEAIELYEQLEAQADLPDQAADRAEAQSPQLADLQSLVLSLMSKGKLREAVTPSLFSLLLALLDPQTTSALVLNTHTLIAEWRQKDSWLEEQYQKQVQRLEEQATWITELEQGKAWLEKQWRNWQRIAEEREAVIRRMDEYLTKLRLKPLVRLAIRLGFLRLNDDEG